MLSAHASVAENLARLQATIADAAVRAGRRPDEITLVGISKTHPPEAVAEAVRAGVRHVGENRVQEAAAKLPLALRQLELMGVQPPTFHLVGHLQTNKAAAASDLFDRIDSVDSLKVAQALSRRLPAAAVLPVLIEVYVGKDPARPGVRPDQLEDVAGAILEVPGIRVEGFMTVAPLGGDARTAFAQVCRLRDSMSRRFARVHFGVLSMGMSEDFQAAIHEGSTEIRVGTALFGPRQLQREI
jgi:pyridoxal phosphate enzyme (YggS family)